MDNIINLQVLYKSSTVLIDDVIYLRTGYSSHKELVIQLANILIVNKEEHYLFRNAIFKVLQHV